MPRIRPWKWLGIATAAVLFSTGCASGHAGLRVTASPGAPPGAVDRTVNSATPLAAAGSSLDEYIGAMLKLSQTARPAGATDRAASVESTDPALAAALRALQAPHTASSEDRAAELYRRAGIMDLAYEHYTNALRLDPQDAAAFDGRARIWRDWGFPGFGLGDAWRAVYFAPQSAAARNTLGTLLQAIGHLGAAREQYLTALALRPEAPFALNNLCYAAIMAGSRSAIATCRRAVAGAPDNRMVQHNLALAYAAAGRLREARREFEAADPADASYNMGVVCFATGRYAEAADAFTAAARTGPREATARRLAERARQLAIAQGRSHDDRR